METPIITILGLIVAGLALYRNIVLSKEQVGAKDAQIASLNSQIELLKQLTPAGILDHYVGMKTLLEERIDEGVKKLEKAESEVASHRKRLDALKAEQGQTPDIEIIHFRRVIIILKIMFNMLNGASGAWSLLTAYVDRGIEKSNENAPSSNKISRQLYDLTEKLYDHWIEETDYLMKSPDEEFYARVVDFNYKADEVHRIWSDVLEIGDLLYPFLEEEQPEEKPS